MPGADVKQARNDLTLVSAIRSGDETAMAELYDRYSGIVYAVALRVLGDTGTAEDVLQASLIFLASNMPMPPSQKAYELRLIPMKGAPMPAGMFKPDAHGSAMVINPSLPPGMEAKAFAITIEP